jgi:hypothetical protein
MKKILMVALGCLLSTASLAAADDAEAKRAEAQKKVDEIKVKGCESWKAVVVKSKTCPEQSAAAAKLTCTVATYPEMQTLFAKCYEAPKTATRPPAAAKDTSCKATDDAGASFYDTDQPRMTACMKEVKAAAVKARCAAGVRKTKVTYVYAGRKPLPMTVFCPK